MLSRSRNEQVLKFVFGKFLGVLRRNVRNSGVGSKDVPAKGRGVRMKDTQISAACAIGWSLWVASFAIWGLSWLLGLAEIRALSLIVCGAAVTATVRSYFIDQHYRFKTALAVTASFRDEDAQVHSLR